jgi:hypothetical protein
MHLTRFWSARKFAAIDNRVEFLAVEYFPLEQDFSKFVQQFDIVAEHLFGPFVLPKGLSRELPIN